MLACQFRLVKEKIIESYSPNYTLNSDGKKCSGDSPDAVKWDLKGACEYVGPKVFDSFRTLALRLTLDTSFNKNKRAILLLLDAMIALAEYEHLDSHNDGIEGKRPIEPFKVMRNTRKWKTSTGENHDFEEATE